MFYAIAAIVFILYIRTHNYNYVFDDYVKRDGYLYDIPIEGPPFTFWSRKPSAWYRLFMIGMHVANSWIIYLLWGWAPALLFAVHPLSAHCTAWVTGNYYATTTYFILISYYILHTFPNIWGVLAAMPIYAAALNSTITAIGFPFLFLFGNPWGLTMAFPLVMFLRGKRFTTGMKIRTIFNINQRVSVKITPKRLVSMTKLVARYIYFVFVPSRLGLFMRFGDSIRDFQYRYDEMHRINKEFWASLLLCLTVFIGGLMINPIATLWFFTFIGVHSQFKIMGQFIAQRYLYLPMIGLCVIAGTVLQHYPYLLTAIVTFLIIRTHLFIPAWKNQEAIVRNDIENFPDNPMVYNNISNYYLTQHDMTFTSQVRFHEVGAWLHRALSMSTEDYEIHMNLACWYMSQANLEGSLFYTNKAIKCLEALNEGHIVLKSLYEQKERIEKKLKEVQQKGALGCSSFSPIRKEETNDQRKRETVVECNGDREHQVGEAGLRGCLAGS